MIFKKKLLVKTKQQKLKLEMLKTSSFSSYSTELNKILYNNGYTTSLKGFVHRIVLYIIREKENGRLL